MEQLTIPWLTIPAIAIGVANSAEFRLRRADKTCRRESAAVFRSARRSPNRLPDRYCALASSHESSPYRALSISASAKSAGPLAGRFSIKVDRPALDWRTLPDGKRRCEVTIVIASVGADDRVYSHKVTEMESLVDNKNFESHWDKPVTFNLVSDLPRSTRPVRIVVRDAQNGHIGTADLPRDSLPVR